MLENGNTGFGLLAIVVLVLLGRNLFPPRISFASMIALAIVIAIIFAPIGFLLGAITRIL